MAEHEKIPAQGGEMPPGERAASTGGRGIDTVLGAEPAGNAAQKRNITAALTDDEREKLIDLVDRLIRNPDAVTAKDCIIGNDVRTVQWIAEHTRALLTSPRAAVPAPKGWKLVPIERSYNMRAKALIAFNTTEKKTNDRDDALDAAHRAMLDAAPAAPVAELSEDDAANLITIDRRDLYGFVRGSIKRALEDASHGAAESHESMSAVDCWSEAHTRTIEIFDSMKIAGIGEVQSAAQAVAADGEAGQLTQEVIDFCWNGYKTGQISADHTAKEVFTEVIQSLAAWVAKRAAVSPATASGLPSWFDTFLTNVCEIPDRNSPVGEPDAIIATLDELKNCALNAIEECAGDVPATANERAAFVSLIGYERPETEGCAVDVWDSNRATWSAAIEFARASQAAAPAETREPVGWFDKSLNQIRWRDGLVNADFADRQSFYTYPVSAPADAGEAVTLRAEVARLNAIINMPQSGDFLRAVSIEAEHQRQRWSSDHDAGKTPADWFWLVGYLAGKGLHAHAAGNVEKAEHHVITTAAALANWHLAIFGKTDMRPGTEQPEVQGAQGGKGGEA
ncbi:hypothetical protein [Burkholderia gladioli]|uniref:hypothetical protein n=1 Tax=Burkholderia gladioli TaxID=28095 RepID=UPI001ABB4845|nr:hypothetical protein [Burkholderia gladioli]